MKIAVYTANFGGKDIIRDPLNYRISDTIDYFVISDNNTQSTSAYQLVYKKSRFDDVAKNARYYKILGFEIFTDYDYLIWHDANIQIRHDAVSKLIQYVSDGEHMAVFKHPERDSFYQEARSCIQLDKDFSLKILFQAFVYFVKGLPKNSGLFETGILVRKTAAINVPLYDTWWHNIQKYTRRDQLALPFIKWKYKSKIAILPGRGISNEFSQYHPHLHRNYYIKRDLMRYNSRFLKAVCSKFIKFFESAR